MLVIIITKTQLGFLALLGLIYFAVILIISTMPILILSLINIKQWRITGFGEFTEVENQIEAIMKYRKLFQMPIIISGNLIEGSVVEITDRNERMLVIFGIIEKITDFIM